MGIFELIPYGYGKPTTARTAVQVKGNGSSGTSTTNTTPQPAKLIELQSKLPPGATVSYSPSSKKVTVFNPNAPEGFKTIEYSGTIDEARYDPELVKAVNYAQQGKQYASYDVLNYGQAQPAQKTATTIIETKEGLKVEPKVTGYSLLPANDFQKEQVITPFEGIRLRASMAQTPVEKRQITYQTANLILHRQEPFYRGASEQTGAAVSSAFSQLKQAQMALPAAGNLPRAGLEAGEFLFGDIPRFAVKYGEAYRLYAEEELAMLGSLGSAETRRAYVRGAVAQQERALAGLEPRTRYEKLYQFGRTEVSPAIATYGLLKVGGKAYGAVKSAEGRTNIAKALLPSESVYSRNRLSFGEALKADIESLKPAKPVIAEFQASDAPALAESAKLIYGEGKGPRINPFPFSQMSETAGLRATAEQSKSLLPTTEPNVRVSAKYSLRVTIIEGKGGIEEIKSVDVFVSGKRLKVPLSSVERIPFTKVEGEFLAKEADISKTVIREAWPKDEFIGRRYGEGLEREDVLSYGKGKVEGTITQEIKLGESRTLRGKEYLNTAQDLTTKLKEKGYIFDVKLAKNIKVSGRPGLAKNVKYYEIQLKPAGVQRLLAKRSAIPEGQTPRASVGFKPKSDVDPLNADLSKAGGDSLTQTIYGLKEKTVQIPSIAESPRAAPEPTPVRQISLTKTKAKLATSFEAFKTAIAFGTKGKTKQIEITETKEKGQLIKVPSISNLSKSRERSETQQISILRTREKSRTVVIPYAGQMERTAQKTKTPQLTSQVTVQKERTAIPITASSVREKQRDIIRPGEIVPEEIEPPKPKPRITIKSKWDESRGQSSVNQQPGYNVYAKQKGEYIKVNDKALTREAALALGGEVVDNTTSARFKISKTNQPATMGGGLFNTSKFTEKKGSFIEKNTFRIDTSVEFEGITVNGWKARRKNRMI
jgi:hypothetical protein